MKLSRLTIDGAVIPREMSHKMDASKIEQTIKVKFWYKEGSTNHNLIVGDHYMIGLYNDFNNQKMDIGLMLLSCVNRIAEDKNFLVVKYIFKNPI
jgi:hypothetical protein